MANSKDSSPLPTPAQSLGNAGTGKIYNNNELSYLPPPEPFYIQQGLREKLISKTKENPFVPLGLLFTTVVLSMGLWSMRSGSGRRAQVLMRLRVGGQAFAIAAILVGVYYKAKTDKSDQ